MELQLGKNRLNLEFANLSYYPPGKKDEVSSHEPILKNLSGKFNSGQLTAILGPSGSGKTSLLNALAGFQTTGITGNITINGKERNTHKFRKKSCYIPQDLAMLEKLTTKETMQVAADLKLESSVGKETKNKMIKNILDILGLEKSINTLVSELSGGEKKRLSIGLELLTNPPVMFFDEPTSGLDSISAFQVICHLKSLVKDGRIIVCSIHQPSSSLFELFDAVYLIADGQCLYSGPNQNMTMVFEETGFQCPKFYNRADFALEIATNQRSKDGDIEKLLSRFRYQKSNTAKYQDDDKENTMLTSSKVHETLVQVSEEDDKSLKRSYPQSTWRQYQILFKRTMLCYKRDMVSIRFRIAMHIIVGLLLGITYYDVGNDAKKVFSNIGCLVFYIMFMFVSHVGSSVMAIPEESAVVVREHLNNWYSLKAYFFSKLTTDIPLLVFCTTIFLLTGYFMTNQPNEFVRFLQCWLICFLLNTTAHFMGLTFGALFTDINIAMFMLIAVNFPLQLFSGFFLTLKDVPAHLSWMVNISYFRYAFEGLMLSVYGSERPNLKCSEIYCYFKSPNNVLDEYGMADSNFINDIIALIIWMVLLNISLYCALKWRLHKSK